MTDTAAPLIPEAWAKAILENQAIAYSEGIGCGFNCEDTENDNGNIEAANEMLRWIAKRYPAICAEYEWLPWDRLTLSPPASAADSCQS